MKKFINSFLLLVALILFSNCGYKALDGLETKKVNYKEIRTYGDKRINFKIKNNLIFENSNKQGKNIILEISTNKKKTVKEKNIKNEITKYEINLIARVDLDFLETGKKTGFKVETNGNYTVSDKYSTTLKNEKRLIEDLTNDISNKIKQEINLIINDL